MASTGRRCTVCSLSHKDLLALERAIHGGTMRVSQLARIYSLSTDSIYRHQRSHSPLELRVETPESEILPVVAELTERLIESADDLRRARHVASLNGNALALTRVADSEAKVLALLFDRLGVESTEVPDVLRSGDALRLALVRAIRDEPEIGRSVAEAFRRDHRDQEADELEHVADLAEQRMKGKAIQ